MHIGVNNQVRHLQILLAWIISALTELVIIITNTKIDCGSLDMRLPPRPSLLGRQQNL
jgi:hypothetical protein